MCVILETRQNLPVHEAGVVVGRDAGPAHAPQLPQVGDLQKRERRPSLGSSGLTLVSDRVRHCHQDLSDHS